MQNNVKYFLLSLLFCSALAQADTNTSSVTVEMDPNRAQTVPVNERNAAVADLKTQENLQNQQQALSQGQNFVTAAPDKNDQNYWKEKNTPLENNTNSSDNPIAIDQNKLNQEKQGFKTLLDDWNKQKTKFTSVEFASANDNPSGQNNSTLLNHPVKALPGTLWYATLAGGADSYVPGPVRIQIQEGPFAGGYALGKFQIAPDGTHLILTFDTLSDGNTAFPINAVAVDPHTQISGVTGDIDHHVIGRYVIPGAVGFLQGAVNLLKANQTVVVNGDTSTVSGPHLSNAQLGLLMAGSAADSLKEATTPQGVLRLPEVKIAPGAGVGLLLLKSI